MCWYYLFQLRLHDIEELLFEAELIVSHETVCTPVR
ncbi:transposase-like protein [Paraburkholderia sp. JPY465]